MTHRNSKTPRTYIEGFIATAVTDKTQKVQRTRQATEQTPDQPDNTILLNRHFGVGLVNSLIIQAAGDSDVTPRQMIEDFMHSNQTAVPSVRRKKGRSLDQSILPSENSSLRSTRSSFPSNPNVSRYGDKETPRTYIEGYLAAVGSDVEETPALLPKRKKPSKRRSVLDIPSFSATRSYSSILNDSTDEDLADEPQQIRQPRTRNKIELQVPTNDPVDVNDVDLPLQEDLQRFKRPRTRNRIQLSVPPRQNEAITAVAEVEISSLDTPGGDVTPSAEQNALETPEVGDHTFSPENGSPDQQPGEHITEATREIIREREITNDFREFTTEHSIRFSAPYERQESLTSSDYTKRTSLPQLQTPRSPTVTRSIVQADFSVKPVKSVSAKKGNQSLYAAPSQTLVSLQPVGLPQSDQVSMPQVGMSPTFKVMMSQQNGTPQLTMSSSQLEAKSSHLSQLSVTHTLSQQEIQSRDEHLEALPSSAYAERTSVHQLEASQSPTLTESTSQADLLGNNITPFSATKGNNRSHDSLSQTMVSPHIVLTPQSGRGSILDRENIPTYQVMSEKTGNQQITVLSSPLVAMSSHFSQSRVIRAASQQEIHTREAMDPVGFGQQNRSEFAALHRSSIPPNSEKEVDPSSDLAASPGIMKTSTPVHQEVHIPKSKPRRKKANTVDYTIPPSIVKKLLANISKLKFSKEAVEEVCI
ncbi:hypothetical protein ACJMK2_009942, partial [Sinanodonta woodiana]